ncbi:beta-lactamase-like protein [Pelagophyceae sp. CCMP2097]|nr:beta-lactamase-like protein [Pelagophyceae sp. CCMP2097]
MELVFLGTASCTPSITRGVSCTALRYDGATWLFDAGEGTQIQVQRCSNVHPGSVSKIFVTHTHGDHSFGLPGLLCLIGSNRDKGSEPIDIYGPDGLRLLIRSMLRLTFSRVAAPYRVHELKDVPVQTARGLAPPRDSLARHERELRAASLGRADAAFGEVDGGRDIQPDADGCWTLFETSRQGERHGDVGVRAAPMAHTVPCVGYVVREHDRPGRLDIGLVEPVVQRNAAALKLIGVKQPKRVFRILKDLAPGQSMTFPDGTVVSAEDCLAPPRDGRVVAICGDTADASAMLPLLGERGADVVVHEATNTYIPKYDPQTTAAAVRQTTASHGHSTPEMAAAFAIKAGARRLVLTHFSARYKGDSNPMSMDTMLHIEDQVGTPRCRCARLVAF